MRAASRTRSCPRCGAVRKSIPTLYRGITFRSKLEADWARCFDALKVRWEYEKSGRYFNDTFALVDFWLPDAGQWFEVKAVLNDNDVRRFSAVAGSLRGTAKPFVVFGWPDGLLSFAYSPKNGVLEFCADDIGLGECVRCGTRYFCEVSGDWACPRCGRKSLQWIRTQRPYDAVAGEVGSYEWSGWPAGV